MAIRLENMNPLQVPTWSWLRINSLSLEFMEDGPSAYRKEAKITLPEGVQIDNIFIGAETKAIPDSVKRNYEFISDNYNSALALTIPEGALPDTPIIIEYSLDEENRLLKDYIHIKAEKDSDATVIIKYSGNTKEEAFHFGFTLLEAEKNAKIKIIKLQMLPETATHVDAVAVQAREKAFVNILLNELGSGKTAGACDVLLNSEQSSAHLDGIYIGKNKKEMDLNYRIAFGAKETEGKITVRGALADSSKKTLKSTLDFITGATGAKGSEEETVLALSDKAVNLSAPLLLCGEDNVEGQHATSTGRPDSDKLHYLMCRGFGRREAEQLLVEASFTPLLNKIEIPEIREEITQYIGASIYGKSI